MNGLSASAANVLFTTLTHQLVAAPVNLTEDNKT